MKTRAEVIDVIRRCREGIALLYRDVSSWNENVRKEHEAIIEWDADGKLARQAQAYDVCLTKEGVKLFGDIPEGCGLVAVNTGEGWYLGVRNQVTGEDVRELPYLDGWPDMIGPGFLRSLGFEVV